MVHHSADTRAQRVELLKIGIKYIHTYIRNKIYKFHEVSHMVCCDYNKKINSKSKLLLDKIINDELKNLHIKDLKASSIIRPTIWYITCLHFNFCLVCKF